MRYLYRGLFVSLIFSILSFQVFAAENFSLSEIEPEDRNPEVEAKFIVSSEKGSRGRYCERCSSVAKGDKLSAFAEHKENYQRRWGAVFAAPEVVKALMGAVISLEDPSVKQILEFDSGYGFNAVYAVYFNKQYETHGRPLTWECFDSKSHSLFGREHPQFSHLQHFSSSSKKDFKEFSQEVGKFNNSVLTFLSPLKTEEEYIKIVNDFSRNGGRYLAFLRNEREFKRTHLYRAIQWLKSESLEEIKIENSFEGEEALTLFFFTLHPDGNDIACPKN